MPKVLVVADESWVVNDVRAGLADAAYELTVLDDPLDVGNVYDEVSPDVVIIDLQVRSMGGMAITREIRHTATNGSGAPVIVLLDRSADEFLARRAGAAAQLRKPFNGFALRDLVDRLAEGVPAAAE